MRAGSSDRERLQRALYRRMQRHIRATLERLSVAELIQAVEAETPAETVAQVLSSAPEVGVQAEGSWASAVMRGAVQKQRMLELAGGVFTSGEVARMLGLSLPGVKQRMRRRQLLAVPLGSGEWGFPVRQFDAGGGVRAGLADVLAAWGDESPWVVLSVLVGPDPVSGEGIALERLGDPATREALAALGRSYGSQAAA
ncbi:MAG TPA: hypothetical protein VHG91_01545 [Longimicrobium sp.]|nr:hypothetical protein [Longimicrobium sp.]